LPLEAKLQGKDSFEIRVELMEGYRRWAKTYENRSRKATSGDTLDAFIPRPIRADWQAREPNLGLPPSEHP
jgi:hypothetical protein